MRGIPEATEITLTVEERQQLEALVRSTKCEARMRFRARIVLLAAPGTGTREISRLLRCTIGTASKVAGSLCARSSGGSVGSRRSRRQGEIWSGTSGTHPGDAGDRHLRATPTGRPRCWRANSATFMSSISGVSCEPRRSICPAASPGARAIRHRRSLHDAAGQCCGAVSG